MSTKIFVNLPVKDLERSMQFFRKLGYDFNPQFTDANAACLVISEDIFAMLLVEKFFQTFVPAKTIADARHTAEAIVALSADSRDEVSRIADAALAAGATPHQDPMDHGFMYQRSFQDLDGHVWEYIWMDPEKIQK